MYKFRAFLNLEILKEIMVIYKFRSPEILKEMKIIKNIELS